MVLLLDELAPPPQPARSDAIKPAVAIATTNLWGTVSSFQGGVAQTAPRSGVRSALSTVGDPPTWSDPLIRGSGVKGRVETLLRSDKKPPDGRSHTHREFVTTQRSPATTRLCRCSPQGHAEGSVTAIVALEGALRNVRDEEADEVGDVIDRILAKNRAVEGGDV